MPKQSWIEITDDAYILKRWDRVIEPNGNPETAPVIISDSAGQTWANCKSANHWALHMPGCRLFTAEPPKYSRQLHPYHSMPIPLP